MIRQILKTIGSFVARAPWLTLAVVLVLTALSGWVASQRFRVEMDVSALLPEDSIVAKQFQKPLSDFIGYGFVICALEVKDTAPSGAQENPGAYLLGIKDKVSLALDDQGYFRRAPTGIDADGSLNFISEDLTTIGILKDEDFEKIERRVLNVTEREDRVAEIATRLEDEPTTSVVEGYQQDPFDMLEIFKERSKIPAGPFKTAGRKGYLLSEDGEMLLLFMWPVEPSTDLIFVRSLKDFLDQTKKGLYARNPEWKRSVDIQFTGTHVENAEGASDVQTDIFRSSIVSLVLVVILFIAAFHQPEALLFVIVPLIVGVVWTLGVTSLLIERITQVTLTFAAILIGLGIDFSIHLYNRFLEGRRLGYTKEKSLYEALDKTGPSIVAGAVTTAFAFVGLSMTKFVGFRELGIFGGIGIVMSLVAMVVVLPAMMMLMTPAKARNRAPAASLGLKNITFFVQSYPRLTVAGGLCFVAFLGYHSRYISFNEDFLSLIQPSDSHRQLMEKIENHFDIPTNQVFVVVQDENLDQALQENDKLYQNLMATKGAYDIVKVDSLRDVVPGPSTQLNNLRRFNDIPVDQINQDLRILAEEQGIRPVDFFNPFIDYLNQLQAGVSLTLESDRPPLPVDGLDNMQIFQTFQQYVYHDPKTEKYRVITTVYPPLGEWRDGVPEIFLEGLSRGLKEEPLVLGNAVLSEELKTLVITDLARVVLIVFFLVLIYLSRYFRSFRRGALAMVPVGFAILSILGVMHLLEMKLSYLNILAIPMIVGIGVDSAIHLLARFYEGKEHNMQLAIERTGRAIVITSLTTVAGFGALIVANFQGIREVGFLCIIGTLATLFASLVFLPAILRLLDPKYTYSGGAGDEIG